MIMRKISIHLLCVLQPILNVFLAEADFLEGIPSMNGERIGNEHGNIFSAECLTCGINETFLYDGVCKDAGYREKDAPSRSRIQIYFHVVSMNVVEIKQKEKNIEINMKYYNIWTDDRIRVNPSCTIDRTRHGTKGISVKGFDKKNSKPLNIWYPEGMKIPDISKTSNGPFTTLSFAIGESDLWPVTDSNETIIIREREMHISLFCHFELAMFPLDSQHCDLIESNENDRDLMPLFSPRPNKPYDLTYITDGFNVSFTKIEGYTGKNSSFAGCRIKMQRIISPYVFQYYLPGAAIVFVSHISFIIPPSSVPGRIGLLATLFLTLTTLFINHMVYQFHIQLCLYSIFNNWSRYTSF